MVVLRIKAGSEKGKVYEIDSESLVIGRDRSGAIQILDQGVSRKHAEIFRIGELYFIRDLKSRNGTFVNTEKVSEVVLRFGDQIQIGNTTLVFEDRLARFRDSKEIVVEDSEQPPQAFRPSSTIQIRLTDTQERVGIGQSRPQDTPESRRLSALVGISYIIGSEKNLSKILSKAARELGKAVDADNVFIFRIAESKDGDMGFDLVGRYDRSEEVQKEGGVSRSIIRDCLQQGRAVLTSDAGLDARFQAMASVVMKQIKSVICVPITGLGKNIGVLYVSNSHRAEAFNAEDLELASASGIQLGTIMQLLELVHRSDRIFRDSIRTLVTAVEMRDPANRGRAERIAAICLGVAKELNWNTHECRNAWLAGMLFDIGSIPLSDRDREAHFTLDTRKNHYATELLQNMDGHEEILPALVQQKERWDGSGSPEGIQKNEIHRLAQVLGLACEFERLLHGGSPDRPPGEKEALLKITSMADQQFDGETVRALLHAFRRGKLFNQEVDFFEILQ